MFSAVAAFALAVGGIGAALLIPDAASVPGNVISAGHLVVQINHGQNADLSVANLAPGEVRTADQLITADMAGVAAADLTLTLSGAVDDVFTRNASLTVDAASPALVSALGWDGSSCTGASWRTLAAYPQINELATASDLSLGSLTGSDGAVCVRFEIGLDAAADNSVQATSGAFSMRYALVQTAAVSP